MIQDITPELAKSFNLKSSKGVIVSDVVKGSPADKAGLKRGDVIVRFNGKETENAHMLSQMAAATAPDKKVLIEIVRDDQTKTIYLTVGTMPEGTQQAMSPEGQKEESAWGITAQELTPSLASQLGLPPDTTGVVISEVKTGSPAASS